MTGKAAITVNRPREEVERLWQDPALRPARIHDLDARVVFAEAPGDRGTEIHVDLDTSPRGGRVGELVGKVTGAVPLAKVKDDLRRFKAQVETGVLPRSDGSPEGERFERKLKQRPAQPLTDQELQEVAV
jgi:uncharacterized membrane protein